MIRNQRGLTLIELLISLALGSIVLVLIYQFFFQGIHFSKVVNDKTLLQQEANYMVSSMTKIHQTSDSYTITFDQNPNASFITVDGKQKITFKNEKFRYELLKSTADGTEKTYIPNSFTVVPLQEDIIITIKITSTDKEKQTYQTAITLSRIK
ncbi:prepilin-type N-terminal cleavage/methylation domain-containing protein [Niallia sp.]|uniref:PilW family protein n=1 Tax=Niallia sp. TaxID=2837523 RepID=UPI0028A1D8CF|nr:prepilin-type N-terminal cleavage/methylation domain-containing protein [Niallia sp.]